MALTVGTRMADNSACAGYQSKQCPGGKFAASFGCCMLPTNKYTS